MEPAVLLDLSPSSIVSLIQEALACGLVAIVISTGVYGITILQAYIYVRSSKHNSVGMKSFVALLFILDTASLCLAMDAQFEYVVTDYRKPWLLLKLPRSLAFENMITYLIGTITQCFFAHLLWAHETSHSWAPSLLFLWSLLTLDSDSPDIHPYARSGISIVICVRIYTNPDFASLSTIEMRCLVGIANGLNGLCDVMITTALSYYLHSKRTGFKRTDSLINRLIIYAVNRGALTALCQAALTIVFVAFPGHLYHLPFDLLSGKLYCNTLFATLNAQKTIITNEENAIEVGAHILNPRRMDASAGGETSRAHTDDGTPTVIDISNDSWKGQGNGL